MTLATTWSKDDDAGEKKYSVLARKYAKPSVAASISPCMCNVQDTVPGLLLVDSFEQIVDIS